MGARRRCRRSSSTIRSCFYRHIAVLRVAVPHSYQEKRLTSVDQATFISRELTHPLHSTLLMTKIGNNLTKSGLDYMNEVAGLLISRNGKSLVEHRGMGDEEAQLKARFATYAGGFLRGTIIPHSNRLDDSEEERVYRALFATTFFLTIASDLQTRPNGALWGHFVAPVLQQDASKKFYPLSNLDMNNSPIAEKLKTKADAAVTTASRARAAKEAAKKAAEKAAKKDEIADKEAFDKKIGRAAAKAREKERKALEQHAEKQRKREEFLHAAPSPPRQSTTNKKKQMKKERTAATREENKASKKQAVKQQAERKRKREETSASNEQLAPADEEAADTTGPSLIAAPSTDHGAETAAMSTTHIEDLTDAAPPAKKLHIDAAADMAARADEKPTAESAEAEGPVTSGKTMAQHHEERRAKTLRYGNENEDAPPELDEESLFMPEHGEVTSTGGPDMQEHDRDHGEAEIAARKKEIVALFSDSEEEEERESVGVKRKRKHGDSEDGGSGKKGAGSSSVRKAAARRRTNVKVMG